MTPDIPCSIRRPSLPLLGSEPLRAASEYLRHRLRNSAMEANGDGHPVMIFPGFCASERFVAPLHRNCRSLGYNVIDWGRGYNLGPRGDMHAWMATLANHASTLLAGFTQPPSLIGYSLGGLYAREVAKLLPHKVRQVITIGTPFNADADHSNVGWLFRLLSGAAQVFDHAHVQQLRAPPPVPTTSIYSRADGIVAWQTCLHDKDHALSQDIEIDGSHLGMPWNAEVLHVIENRLAIDRGRWAPFVKHPAARPERVQPAVDVLTEAARRQLVAYDRLA
jgi:hypothetical protein